MLLFIRHRSPKLERQCFHRFDISDAPIMVLVLLRSLRSAFRSWADPFLEIIVLRQQATVLKKETPRSMIRDSDRSYNEFFRRRVEHMGIERVITAPRSPWQDRYVERLAGSIRRECPDHVIVLGETHLRRILASYFAYYHHARTHLSLDRNAPFPRYVEPPRPAAESSPSRRSAAYTTVTNEPHKKAKGETPVRVPVLLLP